jgi:hypothetical protein
MKQKRNTSLSYALAKAITVGRRPEERLTSREEVLVNLLRKRALAHAIGATAHEAMLRDQIRWALPMVNAQ